MEGKSSRTKEEKARIVMEALTGNTSIAEICRRYNVTSSAFYKWRDAFIAGGTASLEAGKTSKEMQMQREMENLKTIIGDLTVANETLKKIQLSRRGGKP
ncbi:MAG: transposase repeat family ISCc3 [Thermoplasmatales archaeon I-plasma]|jgi:Transposase.|nr:MAG: transposase repeat family ISCc3 [Thermoplasmatales archaeon I-plasma]